MNIPWIYLLYSRHIWTVAIVTTSTLNTTYVRRCHHPSIEANLWMVNQSYITEDVARHPEILISDSITLHGRVGHKLRGNESLSSWRAAKQTEINTRDEGPPPMKSSLIHPSARSLKRPTDKQTDTQTYTHAASQTTQQKDTPTCLRPETTRQADINTGRHA